MKKRLHLLLPLYIVLLSLVSILSGLFSCTTFARGLSTPRTVRVGWYEAKGLQDGTSPETLGGYNYEYLVRIAQHANWQYEFIFDNFDVLLQKLATGEIDIIGDVAKTPEREQHYFFSASPSGTSRLLLVSRQNDTRFSYNDYPSFNGASVATSPSSFRRSMLNREAKRYHFKITYQEYHNDTAMMDALDQGLADLAIFSDAIQFRAYKILHEWEPASQYFIVTKHKPLVLYELNQAMEALSTTDRFIHERLFRKYFSSNSMDYNIALTRSELSFAERQLPLKVLLAENQKPLAYREDGKDKGFIPAYLDLLTQKTGLQFKIIWCSDYHDMETRFRAGEGDLGGQFHDNYSPKMMQGLKKIRPYLTVSYGYIYHPAHTQIIKTVAVENSDYLLASRLEAAGLKPVFYPTPAACLDAILAQEVDAASMAAVIFDQLAYHYQYEGLIFSGQPDLDTGLCLALSAQENPLLFNILNKATGSIGQTTSQALLNTSSRLKPAYTWLDYLALNRNLVFLILLLIAAIIFTLLWLQRRRQYEKNLEQANREIKDKNTQLQQVTLMRNQFFNNLSHDMRTPLTGILGYTELGMAAPVEEQGQYLQKIHQSGTMLLSLINDTLNLAKMENEQFKLASEKIVLAEFLAAVATSIQAQVTKKEQHLLCNFVISPGECIITDKLKLQDLLLNLLSNASKYTPADGIINFTVTHAQEGNKLLYQIIVEDNGIGISETYLPHLYEAFSQEHDARSGNTTGTGLGMAIIKRIVELMHGKITVASIKNHGTKFIVLLPLEVCPAVMEATSSPGSIRATSQKQERTSSLLIKEEPVSILAGMQVLLCEDNPVNQEIIRKLLANHGVRLTIAANGEDGVQAFLAQPPFTFKAILMDLRMPVLDGYGTTKKIRALVRADAGTIPIIALTADAYSDIVQKCLACGMNAHLSKPIDSDKLYAILSRLTKEI